MKQYKVTGMSCASCQAHVEKAVSKLPGVESVAVSLLTNSMSVEGAVSPEEVIRAVENAGYGAELSGGSPNGGQERDGSQSAGQGNRILDQQAEALKDRETPKLARRLAISIGWLLLLMYLTMGHHMLGLPVPGFLADNYAGLALTQMLIAIIVMYINRAFFVSGFRSLVRGTPNMDTLVALGSGVSFGFSLYIFYKLTVLMTGGASKMDLMDLYHNQLYFESAAMIPALITVGKTLEAVSKGRTTDALKHLLQMAPRTAVVEREGIRREVGIEEVAIDDIFLVKPGEAIPVDGVILDGMTAVDESALTGESIPVDKMVGDSVSAATINRSGFIRARATRVGNDTTFAQIIQMIQDAAVTKAPIARIADRVSGVFVPAVMGIALVVGIIWLILGRTPAYALERAISVLVVSCPCALGLATPVAIMVGNGVGARNGILFKTSEALEMTGKVKIVALDKTGTITEGRPTLTDLVPAEAVTAEELLVKAYSLERQSEHPLARAIVAYGDARHIQAEAVTDFQALPGNGLIGKCHGSLLCGGSTAYIQSRLGIPEQMLAQAETLANQGKTPLFFAEGDRILGIIAVADVIREDSARAVKELQDLGLQVVMLTGDNVRTAEAIGREAGVDRVIAGVLPDGKEAVIRDLQKQGRVAMVGDGINDAPALMRSDIGIAIGAGTDVAIDSADIVLMNSRLTDVAAAIRLSRKTLKNIYENLFWAFAYNALLIPMAAGAYPGVRMNPMWSAAAMSLSSFTVCMNALRLNLAGIHADRRGRAADSAGQVTGAGQEPGADHNICSECNSRKADVNIQQGDNTMTKTVTIKGMMCGHCEATVKKALEQIDGIESAVVSHEAGTAVITTSRDVEEAVVRQAIEDKDFTYVGME